MFIHSPLSRALFKAGIIAWSVIGVVFPAIDTASADTTPSYKLESLEITGSTRVSSAQLRELLHIRDHQTMSEEWIAQARTELLGLGLFSDVIFTLKKGSKNGLAKLVIIATDDDNVLSDWAVGGEFGLSLTEPTPAFGEDSVFRGYKVGLIGRNIFQQAHRAAILTDIDSRGSLVSGQIAYGLPRFLAEEIQFDAAVSAVEARERYLDAEGFGLKIQSVWTRQRHGFDLVHGIGWYSNTHSRYKLEGFPELVAGPKLGVIRETRFLGFIPNEGYRVGFSIMPSLLRRNEAVTEGEVAATLAAGSWFSWSVSANSLTTGRHAVSNRAETRVDVPVKSISKGLSSLLYLSAKAGNDHYKDISINANEYVAGFRYHSTGFIGDLNFRIVGKHPWPEKTLRPAP